MNLKCFFGFHDYHPVNGLYWKYNTTELSGIMLGIQIVKLYTCTSCEKIKERIIEEYSHSQFDIAEVRSYLEGYGIQHITKFYDDE